ncbi:MAG: PTS IIA-like nitrogen regulatory protein PtsN [Pseudomonadota bacterium]
MELSSLLAPEAIRAGVKPTSKKRLLQDIASLAQATTGLAEAQVFDALSAREQLSPTGMGRGVAIPHARMAGLSAVQGLFLRLDRPVEFEAMDGQPVDLVFALLAPEEGATEHLRALARVSRTLRDEEVCEKLRSTEEPAALFAILTEQATSKAA